MKPGSVYGFEGVNPLGLKLVPEVVWNAGGMTKGQLAKHVLPADLEFDYSLPQVWLDAQCRSPYGEVNVDRYTRIVSRCVWAYPKGAGYFGVCLDLVTGEVWL